MVSLLFWVRNPVCTKNADNVQIYHLSGKKEKPRELHSLITFLFDGGVHQPESK